MIKRNRIPICLLITAAACLVIFTCGQKEESVRPLVATMIDSVASVDDMAIYYETAGAGDRALVFVHGWSCDRSYWDEQLQEFAGDYSVVAVDLAGHGESAREREDWTIASFGADVAAVVNKLNWSNVVLIGHSMGGPVTLEAARLLGDRVVGIVGVDNFQDFTHKFDDETIAGFLTPFEQDFAVATDGFVRTMFANRTDTALVEQIVSDMAAAPPEVAIGAFNSLFRYDYIAALNEVSVPIRCINSDHWPTKTKSNKEIAESFEVRIMPGTGHFLHLENPAGFNNLLRETLTDFPTVEGE